MAQKTFVSLVCDITGEEAAETVRFSLDGAQYEIDLTGPRADELRGALAPFITAGRRQGAKPARRRSGGATAPRATSGTADVREWAREQGIEVSDRGRISREILTQYEAAQTPA
jgi:hypothetical protein